MQSFEIITMGSEGLEPTTPAVSWQCLKRCSQSGVLTKLDDEPEAFASLPSAFV